MTDEQQPEPTSYADRLDPDGEVRMMVKAAKVISSRPVSWLLKKAGVDADTIEQMRGIPGQAQGLLGGNERIASLLAPLGWPIFEMAPWDEYMKAADLVEQGEVDAAEELLVEAWNGESCLSFVRTRVVGLYSCSDTAGDEVEGQGWEVTHHRTDLIREAYDLHQDGRYGGAIALTLAQMEGITFDFSNAAFFSRSQGKSRAKVVDETTLAGHPLGLLHLSQMWTEQCRTTETSDRLVRHGIMHGRELGYATKLNSTKALAGLLALICWAEPRAKERMRLEREERERRHAGDDGVDDQGRRLDRRGFPEAKSTLMWVRTAQHGWHGSRGEYHRDREIFTNRHDDIQLLTAEDGQSYLAWVETPSGFVFAVGARSDDPGLAWFYAGDHVPAEGPGSAEDWRYELDPDDHPEWIGGG